MVSFGRLRVWGKGSQVSAGSKVCGSSWLVYCFSSCSCWKCIETEDDVQTDGAYYNLKWERLP